MTNEASNERSALIIGCGIGGPVLAMALARVGISAAIYEAHTAAADYAGSFLNVASNGLDVLRQLGALEPVLAQGFPTPRMVMWSGSGKRLGEIANGSTLEDGTVSITIKRRLLQQALRGEAERRGIRVYHDKRLTSVEEAVGGGMIAGFDDGSNAAADMLIGTDGIHSRVRQLLEPTSPPPRYTGLLSVGGVAKTTRAATADEYHMIFGKRAFFGYSVRTTGEAYWFANVLEPKLVSRAELGAISRETWRARLNELFQDDAGPANEMIAATTDELSAYPVYDMPTVQVWRRGAMVILGDAAHATSPSAGQGASLAMEDALVLARCLRESHDTERAFASYEAARRPRVERVVRYSHRIGNAKVAGPVGRVFRDAMMPLALKYLASPRQHDWLYGYRVDWQS